MNLKKFININWYIERKPYPNHSDYDVFYLNICRDLYELIEKVVNMPANAIRLSHEEARELAYILTAYFEDRVNHIGFWEGLVALHKKQFGKRLPFFDEEELKKEEEIYDDIFPSDLHYLIHINCILFLAGEEGKPFISIENPFFIALAESVFNYLDQIEEIFHTEFYDGFLTSPDDYFDLKGKMQWFTFNSYLTGMEFNEKVSEFIEKQMEEEEEEEELRKNFPVRLYSEQDRLMFEAPSSLTGFFPVDLFAGAIRGSDAEKKELSGLKWRPFGVFQLEEFKEKHFHFRHTATGEEFDVLKESFAETSKVMEDNQFWLTKLAAWKGDFWVSGSCMAIPLPLEEIEKQNEKEQHIFQKHYKPYRDKLKQFVTDFRDKATEFFQSDLVLFDSGVELQKRMDEFSVWYFENVSIKDGKNEKAKPAKFDFPADVISSDDLALFIPPADNICIVFDHKKHLQVLQEEISGRPGKEFWSALFWLLNDSVDTEYCFYIWENLELKNLSLILPSMAADRVDFEALLRIYKPQDFSPLRMPRFSLTNM